MDIRNFGRFRAGSAWPATLDIGVIESHEVNGVMAMAFTGRGEKEQGYVQLRKMKGSEWVALFNFLYENMKLPAGWVDSEVLWDSRALHE
jgi:hypothetical protein